MVPLREKFNCPCTRPPHRLTAPGTESRPCRLAIRSQNRSWRSSPRSPARRPGQAPRKAMGSWQQRHGGRRLLRHLLVARARTARSATGRIQQMSALISDRSATSTRTHEPGRRPSRRRPIRRLPSLPDGSCHSRVTDPACSTRSPIAWAPTQARSGARPPPRLRPTPRSRSADPR